MMKQIYIAATFLAIGYFLGSYTWGEKPDTSALDSQIESIGRERDSLQRYIAAKDDTLLAVMNVMWAKEEEVKRLDKQRKILQDEINNFKFKPMPDDAARDSALSKLYPSFHPVR